MKRFTAMFLAFVMAVNMLPLQAFAEDTPAREENSILIVEDTPRQETPDGIPSATDRAGQGTATPAETPALETPAEETAQPAEEPTAEPAFEPTPEPTVRPTAEPVTEPTAEPTAQPTAQPTAEPAPQPVTKKITLTVKGRWPADLPDNDRLLTDWLMTENGLKMSPMSTRGKESLTALEQSFYSFLATSIKNVITSYEDVSTVFPNTEYTGYTGLKTAWTNTELGVDSITEDMGDTVMALFAAQFDFNKILYALLHDYSRACFWIDKTSQMYFSCDFTFDGVDNGDGTATYTKINVDTLSFVFPVTANFAANGNTLMFSRRAKEKYDMAYAPLNAMLYRVYEDFDSTYYRLLGAKDRLCEAAFYNQVAAEKGNFSQNSDPWQFTGVFLGTGAVCEGYSKSYQLLCEGLNAYGDTGFSSYLATGTMTGGTGAGPHMWNIIRIDGKSYIADITNSDEGTIGRGGQLFLAGAEGSVAGGYTVYIDGQPVTYTYDAGTMAILGEDILTISQTDYSFSVDSSLRSGSGAMSNGIAWTVVDTNADGLADSLTITGTGRMEDYTYREDRPWYSFADYIRTVTIGEGITHTGAHSFDYYDNLTAVSLPSTLKSVGKSTFADCKNLKAVTLPESLETIEYAGFYQCGSLETVTLPRSLQTVEKNGFFSCDSLKTLYINGTDTAFGDSVFYSAPLEDVYYAGTPSQFANLEMTGDTNSIANATKHYGKADVTVAAPENGTVTATPATAAKGDTITVTATPARDCRLIYITVDGTAIEGSSFTADFDDTVGVITVSALFSRGDVEIETGTAGDNITWTAWDTDLDGTADKLVFSGSGEMEDVYYGVLPWSGYARTVTEAVVEDGITTISPSTFEDFAAMAKISLPQGLERIGRFAFSGSGITSLVLTDSVSFIGYRAFADCEKLEKVQIDITELNGDMGAFADGLNIFAGCPLLKTAGGEGCDVVFTGTKIPRKIMSGSCLEKVTVPDYITYIGTAAFHNCRNLSKVTIPASVDECGGDTVSETNDDDQYITDSYGPFADCPLLKTAGPAGDGNDYNIEYSWTKKIRRYTFAGSCIENIVFPDTMENISRYAFADCDGLTVVKLSPNQEALGNYSFAYCDNLQKIYGSDIIRTLGEGTFKECIALEKVSLPVISIGEEAFSGCNALVSAGPAWHSQEYSVEFGRLNSLGKKAFQWCFGLEYVYLPDSLKTVQANAFASCEKLENVRFPAALFDIHDFAFVGTGLKSVYLPSCAYLYQLPFDSCDNLTEVFLPDNLVFMYISSFDDEALRDIYYEGTEDEWNSIEIFDFGPSFFDNPNLTIHYNARYGPASVSVTDTEGKKLADTVKLNHYGLDVEMTVKAKVSGVGDFEKYPVASSSDSSVATVAAGAEGEYIITAHAPGKATVTFASADNSDIKKKIIVNVVAMASDAQLVLNAETNADGEYVLTPGKTATAAITWAGGTAWPEYTLSLADGSTGAEFNRAKKTLTATEEGSGAVVFTATNPEGGSITKTVNYRVYAAPVKEITLSDTTVVLDWQRDGRTEYTLTAHAPQGSCDRFVFTYTAHKDFAVEVLDYNSVKVTMLNSTTGKITITAKAIDGSKKTAKCTVTGGVTVDSLSLSSRLAINENREYVLAAGKSAKINATIMPASPTNKALTWTTDNPAVATVKNGTVKAVAPGVAKITAATKDGSQLTDEITVRVTTAANSVLLTDNAGTAKNTTVHLYDGGTATVQLTAQPLAKDGTAAGVFRPVKWTVGGTNAKYVKDLGDGLFEYSRPGKFTVTATATDGTAKKATITVNVLQHVYALNVNPPKNIPSEGNVWIVPVNTVITPAVVYNNADKVHAPAAAYKNYVIETAETALVLNTKGTNVKATQTGLFEITVKNTDSGLSQTVTLQAVAKNSVNFRTLEIRLPAAIADPARVAAGTQPQLTAYLNGLAKLTGTKAQWTVEKTAGEGTALVSATGKLDLRGAVAGDKYRVTLLLTDNSNPDNTKSAYIDIAVTAKPLAADLTLVDSAGTDITAKTLCADGSRDIYRIAATEGASTDYSLKNGSPKVISAEETGENSWKITPLATGTASLTLTAKDGSGLKKTVKIKVSPVANPVKSITLTAKTLYINSDQPVQAGYTLTATKAAPLTRGEIQWTVSDATLLRFAENAAELITEGERGWISLYPQGRTGKVTVTAKAMDGSGKTAKLTVNIVSPAADNTAQTITLRTPANAATGGMLKTAMLTWGKSMQLITSYSPALNKNKTPVYTVRALDADRQETGETPQGVTVKNGKVTVAKKTKTLTPYTGWVRVTATLNYRLADGEGFKEISAHQDIYVCQGAQSVVITDSRNRDVTQLRLAAGETVQLKALQTYRDTSPESQPAYRRILWASSNKALGTVSISGQLKIAANAPKGKTFTVTASAQDGTGKKDTLKVVIVVKCPDCGSEAHTVHPVVEKTLNSDGPQVLEKLNEYRAQAGLDPLEWDEGLVDLANQRAMEITENFGHFNPCTQVECIQRISSAPDRARAAKNWRESSSHWDSISSTKYTNAAVGSVSCNGSTYYVFLGGFTF